MRITKNQLRQIIKEELSGVLSEGRDIPEEIRNMSGKEWHAFKMSGTVPSHKISYYEAVRDQVDPLRPRSESWATFKGGVAPTPGMVHSGELAPKLTPKELQGTTVIPPSTSEYELSGGKSPMVAADQPPMTDEPEEETRVAPGAIDESRHRRKARKVRRK